MSVAYTSASMETHLQKGVSNTFVSCAGMNQPQPALICSFAVQLPECRDARAQWLVHFALRIMDAHVIDAKLQDAHQWANQALQYAQETHNSASQVAVYYESAVTRTARSALCCTMYCNATK